MKKFFPILSWLPNYKSSYLSGDIFAGLTVGVMLIPQGMAYAMIAGLPPVYGLYTALIPQVVYAIFGTSRQLAVGPVAMDSLLVAAGISVIAASGTHHYIVLAILLAFIIGVIQLAFGLFRLGFLVNFLSKPVISGFTSAAALIIGLNQLKHLLGVNLTRNTSIISILEDAIIRINEINWITVFIGIAGILLIVSIKKVNRSIPGGLLVVLFGILAVKAFGLHNYGILIVGDIPSGLPDFSLPDWNKVDVSSLLPAAFTLSLLSFMEAISISKAIHTRHRSEYELRPNQELIALGMGNIIGSMFGAYPSTGGFSRSAVNEQNGANTNLSLIISASLIAITLLFLTPFFYYLPKAVLASVIMVAVFSLIDIKFPKYLWDTRKEDFIMLLIAFLVTLGIGIKEGILISVIMSLIGMIYRSTKPHVAVLGLMEKGRIYRNTERYKNLVIRPDVLIIRYDAELYFANSNHFSEIVRSESLKKGDRLKCIILKANSIAHIDSTAYQVLVELVEDFENKGIAFHITNLIGPVKDFLDKAGYEQIADGQKIFIDVQSAIDYFDTQY